MSEVNHYDLAYRIPHNSSFPEPTQSELALF